VSSPRLSANVSRPAYGSDQPRNPGLGYPHAYMCRHLKPNVLKDP
jgi:hypothetical protein